MHTNSICRRDQNGINSDKYFIFHLIVTIYSETDLPFIISVHISLFLESNGLSIIDRRDYGIGLWIINDCWCWFHAETS